MARARQGPPWVPGGLWRRPPRPGGSSTRRPRARLRRGWSLGVGSSVAPQPGSRPGPPRTWRGAPEPAETEGAGPPGLRRRFARLRSAGARPAPPSPRVPAPLGPCCPCLSPRPAARGETSEPRSPPAPGPRASRDRRWSRALRPGPPWGPRVRGQDAAGAAPAGGAGSRGGFGARARQRPRTTGRGPRRGRGVSGTGPR